MKTNRGIKISEKAGRKVVEGLGYYPPRKIEDLKELIKESALKYGNAIGFRFKDKDGNITGKTYIEFERDIDALGTALISLGLKNSRISIISENRYEWGVCYFATVNGTGVSVPLDKYLPQVEVENLTRRGKVEAIFYSPTYQNMMTEISKTNELIKYFICIGELDELSTSDPRFITLDTLIKQGADLLMKGDGSFIHCQIQRNDLSILLFTSGTTSSSKGVMLSHANIASNVTAISTIIHAGPEDVHLSLLPLHHTFENSIGLIFMVHSGVCIAYCEGIKHIAQNIKEYGVTVLVAVPAIFEAMYKKVNEGVKKAGKERQYLMMIKLSEFLRSLGIDIRRKLFKNVFDKLGTRLRLAVSGAAPLDPGIVTGFDKIGLRVIQGYGLTETSPVVAATNDFIDKPGTIGYPMAGIEVAIDAPDENGMGQIITRGGNVMLGYYEDPEATSEVIDHEGWFKTGDIGFIDSEGFITITGREKSMIVLTNGKKAFPEEYEVILNKISGVKESFVWGNRAPDGDIQICAQLVLDRELLNDETQKSLSNKELSECFLSQIKEINKSLPQYKIIRYFIISEEELMKTTKLSIKRMVQFEKIKKLLDQKGLDMRKASGKFVAEI